MAFDFSTLVSCGAFQSCTVPRSSESGWQRNEVAKRESRKRKRRLARQRKRCLVAQTRTCSKVHPILLIKQEFLRIQYRWHPERQTSVAERIFSMRANALAKIKDTEPQP